MCERWRLKDVAKNTMGGVIGCYKSNQSAAIDGPFGGFGSRKSMTRPLVSSALFGLGFEGARHADSDGCSFLGSRSVSVSHKVGSQQRCWFPFDNNKKQQVTVKQSKSVQTSCISKS